MHSKDQKWNGTKVHIWSVSNTTTYSHWGCSLDCVKFATFILGNFLCSSDNVHKGYVGVIRLLFLIGHMYLNGVWLGVDPRTCIIKDMFIELHLQSFSLALDSQHDWGDLCIHLMESILWMLNSIQHYDLLTLGAPTWLCQICSLHSW
jgi:hypothetical protein